MPEDIPAKAIPLMTDGALTAGDYHSIPFDRDHPLADEPLVKISDYGIAGESYYARLDGENAPYHRPIDGAAVDIWCRKTVAEKLTRVHDGLKAQGFGLFVWDAYRPITCQQGLWDFFIERFREELGTEDPEILKKHTRRYISYPGAFRTDDPATWPTHSTGGAVDLTLRHLDSGKLAEMGTHFDDMRPAVHTDHFERLLAAGKIGENHDALRHRRILYWSMAREGFTNYPYEYFHFGWGEQLSALLNNAKTAWYGYKEPPAQCRIFKSTNSRAGAQPSAARKADRS